MRAWLLIHYAEIVAFSSSESAGYSDVSDKPFVCCSFLVEALHC